MIVNHTKLLMAITLTAEIVAIMDDLERFGYLELKNKTTELYSLLSELHAEGEEHGKQIGTDFQENLKQRLAGMFGHIQGKNAFLANYDNQFNLALVDTNHVVNDGE